MSEKFQTHTVQNIIGYNFKNPSLLVTAFTHSSAAKNHDDSNEGLIFLGRSVCELLVRDYLYSNFMKLETVKVSVSDAEARVSPLLKKLCDNNGLAEYMILSASASALRLSRTIENELFYALVGAIYKDGGMPSARAFVLPKLRAVISYDEPELMREAKKDIIKKAGNERDIFSDNSNNREKRSATSALKSLFSSKKRKTDTSTAVPNATPEAPATPVTEKKPVQEEKQHTDNKPAKKIFENTHENSHNKTIPKQQPQKQGNSTGSPTDGNYKSALQEYVQKNIRSATVMLEYKDSRTQSGCTTEIYLFGKLVAKANGANKKEASQNAAQQAYLAVTANNTEASNWFAQLKADPERAIANAAPTTTNDYISQLNHAYQKKLRRSDASLKYESVPSKNKKLIAFAVIANGEQLGVGEGKNAKEAKQNAAKSALMMLGKL